MVSTETRLERCAAVCIGLLLAPEASATEEATPEGASASLLVGYGVAGEPNVHGIGGGLRVGYTFDVPIYVGALAFAHLGSHDEGEPEVKHFTRDVGLEAGYAFLLDPILLRPSLRAGIAWVTTERDVAGRFMSPQGGIGVTGLVLIDRAHVGLDLDGRIYTRLVNNGDNQYSISTLGVYVVGGAQF